MDAALRSARARLTDSPTAALDARVLMSYVTGLTLADLIAQPTFELNIHAARHFEHLIDARMAGAPIAYLTGTQEFYGRPFHVSPAVLIPRPETEGLVTLALAGAAPARFLDLGTGSGCLIATLLAAWPQAVGEGVDISGPALQVADANLRRHGVRSRAVLHAGDFGEVPLAPAALIVANPPYICADAPLGISVAGFEPPTALFAGDDGLDAVRVIARRLPHLLEPRGRALIEIGAEQGHAAALFQASLPQAAVSVHQDLAGLDRFIRVQT